MGSYDNIWGIDGASARASTSDGGILVTLHSGADGYVSFKPTALQALGLAELLTQVAMADLQNREPQ